MGHPRQLRSKFPPSLLERDHLPIEILASRNLGTQLVPLLHGFRSRDPHLSFQTKGTRCLQKSPLRKSLVQSLVCPCGTLGPVLPKSSFDTLWNSSKLSESSQLWPREVSKLRLVHMHTIQFITRMFTMHGCEMGTSHGRVHKPIISHELAYPSCMYILNMFACECNTS